MTKDNDEQEAVTHTRTSTHSSTDQVRREPSEEGNDAAEPVGAADEAHNDGTASNGLGDEGTITEPREDD